MGRYRACAEALRTLSVAEPVVLDGSSHPLRLVLRTGAEACERLDEVDRKFTWTLQRNAQLEDLLSRVAEVLGREPLPIDGGSWAIFQLAQEVQRALDDMERGSGATHERARLAYHTTAGRRPVGEADGGTQP
jgi:hypothetical protein